MSEQIPDPVDYARASAPAPASTGSMLKALLRKRAFVVTVVVLGVAALGLNTAVNAMQVYFKKQPVALRHKLDHPDEGIPSRIGPWVKVSEQATLNPELQHALGTDQFCFRTYVDERKIGRENAATLSDVDISEGRAKERAGLMGRMMAAHPDAFVSFNVTYYTGMVDTVAHIPDRCYIADGYDTRESKEESWKPTLPDGTTRDFSYRYMTFDDQTGRNRVSRNVMYFFICNGDFANGPIEVRRKLQNLLERNAYYSKIELMTDEPPLPSTTTAASTEIAKQNSQVALNSMKDLLSFALPEVERCLPDWKAVQASAAK